MSFDGKVKQWKCVKGGTVHFQKMSSIVRDIGEPCLHQSPIKISKMLKRDKWEATFDDEGKILGFNKVLKLIVIGGVEPSIRPEVWEFLLGCYSLSSTAEYRQQLRAARRERYKELVKQCQVMHSSVGTGNLAYAVGSKVMDMRMSSKEAVTSPEVHNGRISETSPNKIGDTCNFDTNCKDKNYKCQKKSYSDSGDLLRFRAGSAGRTYDSSDLLSTTETSYCGLASAYDAVEPNSVPRCFLDFPALPVEDLFEENTRDRKPYRIQGDKSSRRRKLTYDDLPMHSFQISNNEDLVVEENRLSSDDISPCGISKCETKGLDIRESLSRSTNLEYENEILDRLKISDTLGMPRTCANLPQGSSSDDRVSEWLWTLHQIVVDVVRTDSHLEFYEDTKNLARMSDILAVYAWADPATGYCQGMSDLLSPFVVLYEDDGDAFWCFEMLLRKMRENFQIEGPTGVLKQLVALWSILELTDREMFSHLSLIGAESLHFAFRMLLVLFRRELSFNEALRMWEMIWAADFDSSLACHLDESCLELLAIELPNDAEAGSGEEYTDSSGVSMHGAAPKNGSMLYPISAFSGIGSLSTRPFCGLTKGLWSRNDHFQNHKVLSSARNADDELPVFCVAAILVMNRQKIIRETHSIDDLIKIFNDNLLKIRVKRCVRTAIKLRKKYFRKLFKNGNLEAQNGGHV